MHSLPQNPATRTGKVIRGRFGSRSPAVFDARAFQKTSWHRTCDQCGQPFVLSFVCGTICDGRERHCPLCIARGMRP